jgi:hypothetical protein
MKPNDRSQTDNNTIRAQTTFYEDCIKLIAYPAFLLISWNMLASTKNMLVNILGEEFDDLHKRVILYRCLKQQQMTDFLIDRSSGILRLSYLPTGTYYCEIVVSNSQNEMITVKRSTTLYYLQDENHAGEKYPWIQLAEDNQSWLDTYSGYTVYD